jgi:hypothetical protein
MLDLADCEGLRARTSTIVEKLLHLLLLHALKDKADRITFELASDEFVMKYRIAGVWNDMIPPPRYLAPEIAATLRRMARIPAAARPVRSSWFPSSVGRPVRIRSRIESGRVILRLNGTIVDVWLQILPAAPGERVSLEIRAAGPVSTLAADSFESYTKVRPGADAALESYLNACRDD